MHRRPSDTTIPQDMPCTRSHAAADRIEGRPIARFIGLGDRYHDERLAWIGQWLRCESTHVYRHWDTRLLSQVHSGFDILVIHGEDGERLAQIIREVRLVFGDKLVLAVMARSLPAARAAALRAGADAVFGPRQEAEVAAAWLGAAIARRDGARTHVGAEQDTPTALTPHERKIMTVLREQRDHPVPYRTIARAIDRPVTPMSVRSIQATVCKLNKKIAGRARIRNVAGAGYLLTTATAVSDPRPAQAG